MLDYNFASSVAGYLSIAFWLIVFTPQLWENYRRKSGDGLSMTFLVIWLAGDVFNLLGVIMQDLLMTMFILALYYTVADMGLIWQVIYYRHSKKVTEEEILPSETSSLLDTTTSTTYSTSASSTKTIAKTKKAKLFNTIAALSIWLVIVISCYSYYYIHNQHNQDGDEDNELLFLPQFMGWTSAVLYVGSRIPQILKNWSNKSTEGLSFAMFICAVLGNVLFTMSIFLKSTDANYILMNLSWIVGSCGTLIFDFIIFIQFFLYTDDGKKTAHVIA